MLIRGSTLVYRRQILSIKVDPRAVNVESQTLTLLMFQLVCFFKVDYMPKLFLCITIFPASFPRALNLCL